MKNLKRNLALTVAVVGLAVGGVLAPNAAQAKKPSGYELCDDGTFHVLSKGDTITDDMGKTVKVNQGYYKTFVAGSMTCYQASTYFHNFLQEGKTFRQSGQPKAWEWTVSRGKYKNQPGGKKNQSWKKAINFSEGCDECGWEGGFIMKKVKKAS